MAEKLISHHEWQTKLPYPTDKVLVRNLSLNANAGLNVWGHKKTQPVHISVTLYLNHPFTSAAQDDKVDQTTVHYGTLSKSILSLVDSRSSEWRNTARLAAVVEEAIQASVASPELLAAYEITVSYPKGCMLGDAAAYTLSKALSSGLASRSLHLKNVRVPCIIGVNSHERLLKQAVVSNVSVDCISDGDASDSYTQLEQIITKTVGDSSFETLESLASLVVDRLVEDFQSNLSAGAVVTLRMEKPVAVPFADAPAIEVVRRVNSSK